MSGECGCEIDIKNRAESRVLIVLLAINAVMFVVELAAGLIADSMALLADSLDMLADAAVYGIGLYGVGRPMAVKIRAANLSGIFQIVLGAAVAVDILRRLVAGSEPQSLSIILVGAVALVANVICVVLIARHRHGEVHMRASWIFSRNDVIANLGVIAGGMLVYVSASNWPDLVIGALIALLVVRGGVGIVREASAERRALVGP